MTLDDLQALAGTDAAAALRALDVFHPAEGERAQAAALALQLGRPRLAVGWATGHDPHTQVAALLRLGQRQGALGLLDTLKDDARVQVLRAHALRTLDAAADARWRARQDGDGPALVAAATLMGELLLPQDPRAALRALAEGLKVCEMMGVEADATLLAVLAAVQRRVGGGIKAEKTAHKALQRSRPGSPGRVIALCVLGRVPEAQAEREAGELRLDVEPFLAPGE